MTMQAITITLNPAIDQTLWLQRLNPGEVHRTAESRNSAGGKGVNVAATLADWGVTTTALGVLGADNASVFESLLRTRGIEDRFERVPGDTRTNIKLVERDSNRTTDINLLGLTLSATHLDAVSATLAPLLQPRLPVVLAGSLPGGLRDDSWARLQEQAARAGARVLLDTSGAPLVAALNAEVPPYAVKPNRRELEAWIGRPLDDEAALLTAARELLARGITQVVISMGAEGALFATTDEMLIARPGRLATGSSVGAGDAMVAGLAAALLQPGADVEARARLATAFSMSRLLSGDAHRIDPAQVRSLAEGVQIRRLG